MPSRERSNSPSRRRGHDDRPRRDEERHHSREPEKHSRYRPSNRDRDRSRDREEERDRDRERDHQRDYDRDRDRDRSYRNYRQSRSRTRSRSPHRRSHRRRTPPSDSESGSESDSEDERRKRRKEEKEERRRRKERKREKKAKREKKKGSAAVTAQWGKYGIISETDLPKKDSEFRTWLVEERKINPETMTKDRTRKEFAVFVEDFNTATLPHEKYYDMAKYEFRMNLIRSGQTIPLDDGEYDPAADIKAHSSLLKSQEKEKESFLCREEIEELRRIERERMEIGKRRILGLDVPRSMGVRTEEVSSMSFD